MYEGNPVDLRMEMLYFDKDRTFVLHRGCERTILSR